MDEEKIDDGNALFCVDWITSYSPEEVVQSLVDTFSGPHHNPADLREMAARLCIIGGALLEALPQVRKKARKRRAMMQQDGSADAPILA